MPNRESFLYYLFVGQYMPMLESHNKGVICYLFFRTMILPTTVVIATATAVTALLT